MKPPSSMPSRKVLNSLRVALRRLRRSELSEGPPVLCLKELVRRFRDPGAALAWLVAYDPDEDIREVARLMLFLAAEEPLVPRQVKEGIRGSATPVLLDALKDASVADERKYYVGPILRVLGVDLPREEYRACFHDFHRVARGMEREAMELLPESAEFVEKGLAMCGLIKDEDPVALGEEEVAQALAFGLTLSERNPNMAAAFLTAATAIAREHGRASQFLEPVLDHVAHLGSARAAWFLRELGGMPTMGSLGDQARELSRQIRGMGVLPAPPHPGEFSYGILSTVDGCGSRSLLLFYRTDMGDLDSLALLINDRIGIKDLWCIFGNASGLEEEVRAWGEGVAYAPCGVEFARELVADAMATHDEIGKPFPGRFILYRHYLGPQPLTPAPRTPNLGAYMLETFARGPGLVKGSEKVFHAPIYGRLWCASEEAYEYIARFMPRGSRKRARSTPGAMPESAFKEFVVRIASRERDTLARRMAVNLEVEALAGRASEPANRAAARTWIALTEDIVPFQDIPFVRRLCRESVLAISTNLRGGYRNQEEANFERLRLDEEADRIASESFEEEW